MATEGVPGPASLGVLTPRRQQREEPPEGLRLWALPGSALLLAAASDWLFWGKEPGIAFPVFIALLAGALLGLARLHGVRPHPRALWLLAPLAALAVGAAIRTDPLTMTLDRLLAVGVIALFAHTLRTGAWPAYGVRDTVLAALRLSGGVCVGAVWASAAAVGGMQARGSAARHAFAVLRGLAIALPLVALFGVLLSSADAIFAARIEDALGRLSLPQPGRVIVFTATAFLLAGLLHHALQHDPHGLVEGRLVRRGLGVTEAGVVLGAVDLLFALFVAVQVRYLFGGRTVAGLTYAEYTRRGFVELVVVALFSLLLLVTVSGLCVHRGPARRVASGLGAVLTALVLVILASAFLRLLASEQAFGFTRTRMYGHVFMVWLGLLLIATAAMELRRRLRAFTLACGIAAIGFALTLTGMGVDGMIVAHNVGRSGELDADYLSGLSADAVPALTAAAAAHSAPGISRALTEQRARLRSPAPWQSWSVAVWRARRALDE